MIAIIRFFETSVRRTLKLAYFGLLICIAVWSLPAARLSGGQTSIGQKIFDFAGPFFRWTGLWQGWGMFASNPSNENLSIQIAIEFWDGTFEFKTWPLLYTMSDWQAYRHERHRKFAENIGRSSNAPAWPQLAEYYRSLYEPKRAVKRIDLVRWWSIIDPADLSHPPPPPPSYMNFEHSHIFHTAEYSKP